MKGPLPQGREWNGLRVVVMGLGQFGGGVAAASYLSKQGAKVCVTDLRNKSELARSCEALSGLDIEWRLGEHRPADFYTADAIVANPAVPPNNTYLQEARKRGIPITSEMELFLLGTRAKLLLVSGTHGKSSTATFLHQLLRDWERPVFLGGNLGRPLLDVPAAHEEQALCVVEISSYQLEALGTQPALRNASAVGLTALAPDHLKRHGSLSAYLQAKARVFELCQTAGCAYLPEAAWDTEPFVKAREQHADLHWFSYGTHGNLHMDADAFSLRRGSVSAPKPWHLTGEFQRHNVLLALALAEAAGLPTDLATERLPLVSGLPHRFQKVLPGPLLGLPQDAQLPAQSDAHPIVYDNGVSTTPETTLAAVRSLAGPGLILIGGQAKNGLDYPGLARACKERGDQVFLFGAAAEDLAEVFASAQTPFTPFADLPSAAQAAWSAAGPGQELLFSPACASFDAYPNFKKRALQFLDLVAQLAQEGHALPNKPSIEPARD